MRLYERRVIFLALCGSCAVGVASMEKNHSSEDCFIIMTVYVDEKYQRMGIGGQLVFALERYAYRRGGRKITVTSAADAVGFYEKLGYACVGDEIIYEKKLGEEQ